jgi:hypothetical protein
MFSVKAGRGRPDLFSSAKTSSPVPARHPALREALIQASLDPAVRSIGHVATAHVAASPVAVDVDAVVLYRDDGRYHLDVVAARRLRDLEDEGLLQIALRDHELKSLVVTAEDVKAEPRCGNCRLVWSHHGRPVPIDLRMRILQILIDDGPMQLGRLLESVHSDREPSAAVMSLACLNLLELDLMSVPLGPDTMVRSRT